MNAVEIGSNKITIPGPGILSVACRVYSHVPTTCSNIAFKGSFLGIIKYCASSHEKNNSAVTRQMCIGKHSSVFSKINPKMMFKSKPLEGYFPIFDGGMAKSTSLGKDEQPPGRWFVSCRSAT